MGKIRLHFTDFFDVDPATLREYGAFNVSLVNDLPLFVDPFLLFNSSDPVYQQLHGDIINYLRFLRSKSERGTLQPGLIKAWYTFPEVKQNWLGFSRTGNRGRGLGARFANSLDSNLSVVFNNFGSESVSTGSHLEKLCLIDAGVGKDGISDFTTNLIKSYLLSYTQTFAREHLTSAQRTTFRVERATFNYDTESWASTEYDLPIHDNDFVLLTPRDILTREDTWIARKSYAERVTDVIATVANEELRDKLNNYLAAQLPDEPTSKDRAKAASELARRYPDVLDYYVRMRENSGDDAVHQSQELVAQTDELLVSQAHELAALLNESTAFYSTGTTTATDAMQRARFLKDVVENKGGHRLFWDGERPVRREQDLHILYRLTWYGTTHDVSREVDDGRGPADFKISQGADDKTIVEFKLASNSQIKRNLENQVPIYQAASDAQVGVKVIFFFSVQELERVKRILNDLDLTDDPHVILVDARKDNKPSASKA